MDFTTVRKNLERNGFAVTVFETAREAADYLNQTIDGLSVGCGVSMTLKEMGLYDSLARHNELIYHLISDDVEAARRAAMGTEIYLLSANAISESSGEILSIDGVGNRAASALFGHRKVYFVAGKNKISPDYETALYRLRNVVAPKNARRMGIKTPCAVKGDRCYDCNSPERICRGLVVHYKRMKSMEMEVVLVNEELGY